VEPLGGDLLGDAAPHVAGAHDADRPFARHRTLPAFGPRPVAVTFAALESSGARLVRARIVGRSGVDKGARATGRSSVRRDGPRGAQRSDAP
jgi:hypothetical protein